MYRTSTHRRRVPPLTAKEHVRRLANAVNLSTALGMAVAAVGGAELRRGPRGTLVATGYRLPVPRASAFTVGDVILTRMTAEQLRSRPRLVRHELRHCMQYACCLGPLMLPAYGLAAAWSIVRTGDPASRNIFERRADLADGGYVERPVRGLRRRQVTGRPAGSRVWRARAGVSPPDDGGSVRTGGG